jgi:two-component system C4-dicarboxylate transport response regulator DctD
MQMVTQIANPGAAIVIRGESGTGKDMLARMLHAASGRGCEPFVKVDCAMRPAERVAARLFGHARDAWAGAGRRRLGAVEFAHRGTLLLDNIEALPLPVQADVLSLVQGEHPGAARAVPAPPLDIQVLLSTRESLPSRRDELQLPGISPVLKVLDLQLAPLRARRSHIRPLAEVFLVHFNAWYGRDACLSDEQLRRLTDHSWPGNIRELEAEIRRFVLAPEPRTLSHDVCSAAGGAPASLGRRTA